MKPTVAEYLHQKETVRGSLQDIDARVILAIDELQRAVHGLSGRQDGLWHAGHEGPDLQRRPKRDDAARDLQQRRHDRHVQQRPGPEGRQG